MTVNFDSTLYSTLKHDLNLKKNRKDVSLLKKFSEVLCYNLTESTLFQFSIFRHVVLFYFLPSFLPSFLLFIFLFYFLLYIPIQYFSAFSLFNLFRKYYISFKL